MHYSPEQQAATEDPDVAVMLALAAGSEKALEVLVHRYQDYLLNYFVRMGAYQDGEDLVQETFLRVYRYRNRYTPRARFQTFLFTVARRVWIDRCRAVMRREKLMDGLRAEIGTGRIAPEQQGATGRALDMQAALRQLPPKLREVLVLNIYQGFRYHEIAAVLGIPLGTVKSRMNLAMSALRKWFEP